MSYVLLLLSFLSRAGFVQATGAVEARTKVRRSTPVRGYRPDGRDRVGQRRRIASDGSPPAAGAPVRMRTRSRRHVQECVSAVPARAHRDVSSFLNHDFDGSTMVGRTTTSTRSFTRIRSAPERKARSAGTVPAARTCSYDRALPTARAPIAISAFRCGRCEGASSVPRGVMNACRRAAPTLTSNAGRTLARVTQTINAQRRSPRGSE